MDYVRQEGLMFEVFGGKSYSQVGFINSHVKQYLAELEEDLKSE